MNLSEIQNQIEVIKALDVKNVTAEQIEQELRKLPLAVPITILKKELYISRYIGGDDFPSHSREVSYPYDAEFVQSYGRCNYPGQQVFYGAVMSGKIEEPRVVGYSEIFDFKNFDRTKRHFVATSKWLVLDEIYLVELYLRDEQIRNKIAANANKFHKEQLATLPDESRKPHEEILSYLSDEFSEPEGKYQITSTISNSYYGMSFRQTSGSRTFSVEGITYPSVKTEGTGMNVALLPGAVDNKLSLEMVVIDEVIPTGPKTFYLITTKLVQV